VPRVINKVRRTFGLTNMRLVREPKPEVLKASD
jgi:hypothetical protein